MLQPPAHTLPLTAYPSIGEGGNPIFFIKMIAKGVKEITYIPYITFFSVLERPGKNRKWGLQPLLLSHPLVRRGLINNLYVNL